MILSFHLLVLRFKDAEFGFPFPQLQVPAELSIRYGFRSLFADGIGHQPALHFPPFGFEPFGFLPCSFPPFGFEPFGLPPLRFPPLSFPPLGFEPLRLPPLRLPPLGPACRFVCLGGGPDDATEFRLGHGPDPAQLLHWHASFISGTEVVEQFFRVTHDFSDKLGERALAARCDGNLHPGALFLTGRPVVLARQAVEPDLENGKSSVALAGAQHSIDSVRRLVNDQKRGEVPCCLAGPAGKPEDELGHSGGLVGLPGRSWPHVHPAKLEEITERRRQEEPVLRFHHDPVENPGVLPVAAHDEQASCRVVRAGTEFSVPAITRTGHMLPPLGDL